MFPWTRIKNFVGTADLFSKKRSIVLEENQGETGYEGTPVKARPNTRRRMLAAHATAKYHIRRWMEAVASGDPECL